MTHKTFNIKTLYKPKETTKIVSLVYRQVLVVFIITFSFISYFWLKREYNNLQEEITRIQEENIALQKEIVKKETEKAVDYINFKINRADKNLIEIQEEILEWFSTYRFYEEGYIFINAYNGDVLLFNGEIIKDGRNNWNLEDPNGVKVIQEERNAVKNPNGDFIYYTWPKHTNSNIQPKISFIKGVPRLKWMVGAGVYVDDINHIINKKKEVVIKTLKTDILIIAFSIFLLFGILYLLTRFISKRTSINISSFIQFFKNASNDNVLIDKSKINYYEFNVLADSANEMISEIKKAQSQTQKEKAHFQKLFDESPEAIAFLDNNGLVKKINPAFTALFGYEIKSIIDKNIDDFIVPKELKEEAIYLTNKFIEGVNTQVDSIRRTKNNHNIHVSIIQTPFNVDQKQVGYYVIYRDISKQKKFEKELSDAKNKAEESDRLKSSFLANLSHEIRTPLNSIVGFSTLLNNRELPIETQKEFISILTQSGKDLLEIIEGIIDVSKVESSTLSVNRTNFKLNILLVQIFLHFQEFKNKMNFERIELILNKEIENDELYVFADEKRVKQVFSQLLDNALKFTEKGKVEFGYELKEGKIVCYVKDTGIGIKDEDLEYIFDRFRQADETLSRKYGGNGIGLALCKSLIHLMEGEIWVESVHEGKQKGTIFYFTIPKGKVN